MGSRSGCWLSGVLGVIVVALVIGLFGACSAVKRVDPGNVGVLIDYNKKDPQDSSKPYVENVGNGQYRFTSPTQQLIQYPIAQQTLVMVRAEKEGQVVGDDSILCPDKTGIPMHIDTSVVWHVDTAHAADLYFLRPNQSTGAIQDNLVRQEAKALIPSVCSGIGYREVFTGTTRTDMGERATTLLANKLAPFFIKVDSVVLREIHFDKGLTDAINENNQAAISANTAQLTAAGTKAKAEGERDADIARANGRSEAARVELERYGNFDNYLKAKSLEKWNGQVPLVSDGAAPFAFTMPITATR